MEIRARVWNAGRMDFSTAANLINAVAVTAGVVFAAAQIRDYRRQRRRDAMLELVRSFQSPDFTRAIRRINSLPEGATRRQIQESGGEDDIFLAALTWESLGVLLFRREIDIDLMDDFFSGAIVISWRKLEAFVEQDRRELARETVWEWFQWLAERMMEHEKRVPPVPAHLAHREWRA
jgi:hypothetical protein